MNKTNRGSLSFGMQIILFILVIFILWTLFGNKSNTNTKNSGSFYKTVNTSNYTPELPTAGY